MIWLYDLLRQEIRRKELLEKDKSESVYDIIVKKTNEDYGYNFLETKEDAKERVEKSLHEGRVSALEKMGDLKKKRVVSNSEFLQTKKKVLASTKPNVYIDLALTLHKYNNLYKEGLLSEEDFGKIKAELLATDL